MTRSAIILAAGLGTRMAPITPGTSKELIPLLGRPIVVRILERVKRAGIEQISVVTSPSKAVAMREALARHGFADQVRVLIQVEPRGSADATRVALREAPLTDQVLVYYGDSFCREDVIPSALATAAEKPSGAIVVRPVDDPTRYGIVRLEGDEVVEVVEKPARGQEPSQLAVMGVFVVSGPALRDALKAEAFDGRKKEQFPVQYMLARGARGLGMVTYMGGRVDLGMPKDLFSASLLLDPTPIREIAFDGDNTLYPTRDSSAEADRAAIARMTEVATVGTPIEELFEDWRRIVAEITTGPTATDPSTRSRRCSYERLCATRGVPASVATEMYEVFAQRVCAIARPYPEALEILDWCAANDVKVHLFSECNRDLLDRKLAAMRLTGRFATVCGAEDVGSMKPHPGYYRALVPWAPGVLVVGDSYRNDLALAAAAGWHVYLVTHAQAPHCLPVAESLNLLLKQLQDQGRT